MELCYGFRMFMFLFITFPVVRCGVFIQSNLKSSDNKMRTTVLLIENGMELKHHYENNLFRFNQRGMDLLAYHLPHQIYLIDYRDAEKKETTALISI